VVFDEKGRGGGISGGQPAFAIVQKEKGGREKKPLLWGRGGIENYRTKRFSSAAPRIEGEDLWTVPRGINFANEGEDASKGRKRWKKNGRASGVLGPRGKKYKGVCPDIVNS